MKNLIILIIGAFIFVPNAEASYKDAIVLSDSSFGCVTDVTSEPIAVSSVDLQGYTLASHEGVPSCKSLKELRSVLGSTAIALQAGTIVLACSGVGTSVSVLVQVSSLAVKYIDLKVGDLDCRDYEKEEEIHKATIETTCQVMNRLGVECDPATITDKPFTPIKRGQEI